MRHNISENTHLGNISLSLWLSYCISLSLWFISYCIFYQLLYFGRSATFSGNSQHQICPKLEEEILSPSLIQGHRQLSLIICPLMVPIGDKGKLHWLQLKSDSRDVSYCTLPDQRPPSIRFVQTWRWGGWWCKASKGTFGLMTKQIYHHSPFSAPPCQIWFVSGENTFPWTDISMHSFLLCLCFKKKKIHEMRGQIKWQDQHWHGGDK